MNPRRNYWRSPGFLEFGTGISGYIPFGVPVDIPGKSPAGIPAKISVGILIEADKETPRNSSRNATTGMPSKILRDISVGNLIKFPENFLNENW